MTLFTCQYLLFSPFRARKKFVQKTNIYTWFKLSGNQPFLPHFEFLFEYHYDVTFHVTRSIQPWLIQCLKRKFLKSFLQLLELKCMVVEDKQLYIRGGSRPKIEPCLNMLEFVTFQIVCYALRLRMNTFGGAFFNRLKWGCPASLAPPAPPSSLAYQSCVTSHVIPQMDSLLAG